MTSPRLLLFMDNDRNRHLLAQFLGQHYEATEASCPEALAEPFDVGIVDAAALTHHWDAIRARKAAEAPVQLPILTLMPPQAESASLRAEDSWDVVDEVLFRPVDKAELELRLQRLIRERQRSSSQAAERRRLFEEVPIGLYRTSPDGTIQEANRALVRMLDVSGKAEFVGQRLSAFCLDTSMWFHRDEALNAGGVSHGVEMQFFSQNGTVIWAEDNVRAVYDNEGGLSHYEGSLTNITHHKVAEEARRESEAKYRTLFEQSRDPVFITDRDWTLLELNLAAARLFGVAREEVPQHDLRELACFEPGDLERLASKLESQGFARDFEITFWPGHQNESRCLVSATLRRDEDDHAIGYQGIIRDVTEQKRLEAELTYFANRDPLTGLFNRRRFKEELDIQLARAQRSGTRGALLWLDLDRFKELNDALGHQAGDDILSDVASLLQDRLRESDISARMGGDEFTVLLPETDADGAEVVADKLLTSLRKHVIDVSAQPQRITATIGVALFPEHGLTADSILTFADLAMYRAKQASRDRYFFHGPAEDGQDSMKMNLNWANRIREALEEDRFILYSQPIRNLHTDETNSYELLLRLQEGEVVSTPGAFLDAARQFGLMGAIDRWVIQEAFRILAERQRNGRWEHLEVNISAPSLSDPEVLAMLRRHLEATGVDPHFLIFEITESDAISNIYQAHKFIGQLKELGGKFALDDFGVGFSSFSHLQQLDVDYLKVDGSFIRDLATDPFQQRVVRSIVDIAQAMGIQTVAEFVEDGATLEQVRGHGIDHAQGFHLGYPQPLADGGD